MASVRASSTRKYLGPPGALLARARNRRLRACTALSAMAPINSSGHASGYMCVVLKTILYSNYRSNDDCDLMRIRLLGTGTPTPSLKRMSSGYLVETAQRKVLFDFGPGTYHRMLEAGVRAVDITDVFFTHLHYDHCLDYVRLLMTRWDQGAGRIPELNVYGPAYTARMTEAIIGEGRTVRSRPRGAHRAAHEPGRLCRSRRHAAATQAEARRARDWQRRGHRLRRL